MLQTRAGYRACANKRIEIAEHLRYLPMGWFNDNSLGEVTSVTTNTMENMANVATRVVMVTTRGFLTSGIIAVMMFLFDWRMGLITLAGLLLFFAVNAAMQRAEQALSQRKFNADERLVSKVLEYVQGIAEVKNFDLTHDSATQVHGAVEEARKASFAMEIPSVLYMLAQFVVNKLTGVAVCAAAIVFYFSGTMELTNCLLMLICSFILFEQLDSAGSFSALFRSIDIGVDKASAILRVEPMDIDGEELSPEREDITLSHVDFSYDSKPILHDVSLTIPEKTTVAIVGPSGSGKTTLCNLMARFWDVQGGSVRLGGRDVREYSYGQASSAISPLCFSGSICSRTPSPTISALASPTPPWRRCRPPRKKPAATTLSWHCRTALTPSSAKAVLRFRAASASAFPSPGQL